MSISMGALLSTFLGIWLLAGCVLPSASISEQHAREIAIQSSNSDHLRSMELPKVLQARLVTLENAQKALGKNDDSSQGRDPMTMVWLVALEGTWILSGGPPTPAGAMLTPPTTFHHYAVILDARTGVVIGENATP